MHGLVNRSFQRFLIETYGRYVWEDVADRSAVSRDGFEALEIYDDRVSEAVLGNSLTVLERPREGLLEDFGIFLVSHPTSEAIRRLLRFGGSTFLEFLQSLDELPDRARLAMPDLDLPQLTLQEVHPGSFLLTCEWSFSGAGHVIAGVLRTMADDYGDLVLLEHCGSHRGCERITIELLQQDFSAGRDFRLAAHS